MKDDKLYQAYLEAKEYCESDSLANISDYGYRFGVAVKIISEKEGIDEKELRSFISIHIGGNSVKHKDKLMRLELRRLSKEERELLEYHWKALNDEIKGLRDSGEVVYLSKYLDEYCLMNRVDAYQLRCYARIFETPEGDLDIEKEGFTSDASRVYSIEDERKMEKLAWHLRVPKAYQTKAMKKELKELLEWYQDYIRERLPEGIKLVVANIIE